MRFRLAPLILPFLFLGASGSYAQDGKALFSQNCASCHSVTKKLTGPALMGVEERWGGDKKKLFAWIRNSQAFLKTGDDYANKLFIEYNKVPMNQFLTLTDAELEALLVYINTSATTQATKTATTIAPVAEQDNTLLYFILAAVLFVLLLLLWRLNVKLKRIADLRVGNSPAEIVPAWKNKTNIALVTILLICGIGYFLTKGAINLGRAQNYQPEQPIFYSHKVHAGVNQINCLYCHTGAQQGKQATIPSVNVCMNCHMAINEYSEKSEKLYKEDGTEVNGTEEIKKLYKYAGFKPGTPWEPNKATPIAWVRIHTLPDHVYFNHSQHVNVGKVACQTCHGEIQNMTEVKQFSPLSMSWCVNCHRETQVQFKDNGFYSIYEKYHADLKSGKIDPDKGVTVEKIGGTECQKCHY